MDKRDRLTAFAGHKQIARGNRAHVARAVKSLLETDDPPAVLVFEEPTGQQVDLDMRGSLADVEARYASARLPGARRKPGRPKLGVVGKEVTLLPRHWDWLNDQPGGASVTLRRLVDRARASDGREERVRRAREAVFRFITAIAGDRAGYEDACRALFAGDRTAYDGHTRDWPDDVRDYVARLAGEAFAEI